MRERSDGLDKLIPALLTAKESFRPIRRDGYNRHFKSKFATLKAVKEATEESLAANGLMVVQFPSSSEGKPALTTWLVHKSGQYIVDTTVLALSKNDPQAQGSGITYLRRYGWSSVLGLVSDEDDDDGHVASNTPPRVGQAKLAEIKRLAGEAEVPLPDVEQMAFKNFNKQMPYLTPGEADQVAVWLAEKVVKA